MASPFILYGKPLAQPGDELLPLQVVGTLPDYSVGNAFEGRLDILNAIGKSKVEIVESSLPPGAYAYVDQLTQEVVLKWPSFSAEVPTGNSIPNGDFENGDDGSWILEKGWTIQEFPSGGENNVTNGTHSAVFENQNGIAAARSAPVPCRVNDPITLTGHFRQGASSRGNLVGRLLISWCDIHGKILSETQGDLVKDGSGNGFQTLTLSATAPAGTETVRAGFVANRKRQNKPAKIDGFSWNHKYELGTTLPVDYTVTLKVTDSVNRVAYWSGSVLYQSFWMTSTLFPLLGTEPRLSLIPEVSDFLHFNPEVPLTPLEDFAGVSAEVSDFSHVTSELAQYAYAGVSAEVGLFKHYNLTQNIYERATTVSAETSAFVHYELSTYSNDGANVSAQITGFTHG